MCINVFSFRCPVRITAMTQSSHPGSECVWGLMWSVPGPDRGATEDHQHLRGGQAVPAAGAGDAGVASEEGARGQEADGAADAGHGVGHAAQVGEGMCT